MGTKEDEKYIQAGITCENCEKGTNYRGGTTFCPVSGRYEDSNFFCINFDDGE